MVAVVDDAGQNAAVTQPDASIGVKESPVVDTLIVDRKASDDSEEPRLDIANLSPGDAIALRGDRVELSSTGKRMNHGQTGLFRLGFMEPRTDTVASLWVDRDPYLLDICNGPIETVDPADVEVLEADE